MYDKEVLGQCGLAATANREQVVRALARAARPVTPQELLAELGARMNRVTLYRILDLLVEHGVATRHNAGERAFRYCLHSGPSGHVAGHAHFTCTRCGQTQCLDSQSLGAGLGDFLAQLSRSGAMRVDTAEVRFGGVCQGCLSL